MKSNGSDMNAPREIAELRERFYWVLCTTLTIAAVNAWMNELPAVTRFVRVM
jgi:hypothetical protein